MFVQPEKLAAIADEMHSIEAALGAASAAAAAPTTGVVPAAADVVSMLTAAQFASHARDFQGLTTQAAIMREQMATLLGICAGSYASTEAANTTAVR